MKLSTERLRLRELEMEDAVDLVRNLDNLNVSRYMSMVPYPYTLENALEWIAHCRENRGKSPRENYDLGVELKSDGRIIGGVGITKVGNPERSPEMGYYLAEDCWGRGYMSEAATAMVGFAFERSNLERIEAHIAPENRASIGLAESLGFRYERTEEGALRPISTGKVHDKGVYGLLRGS